MELKDLEWFVVVAEELHFGRAATRLHISPPPLTQRIKRLERELGVTLFDRDNRNVALAPAGAALLEQARDLLTHARRIAPRLQEVALGKTGRLQVGITGAAIYSNARTRLASKLVAVAGLEVGWIVMSSAEQVKALRERRIDLGLVNTPIDHEGVELSALQDERLAVALPSSHPLATRRSVPLGALRDEVFILGERHLAPAYYDRVISACQQAGFVPLVEHQPQSLVTYIGLVALGAGITVAPASMARAGLTGVSYVAISGRAPRAEISLAWPSGKPDIAVERILAALRIRFAGARREP